MRPSAAKRGPKSAKASGQERKTNRSSTESDNGLSDCGGSAVRGAALYTHRGADGRIRPNLTGCRRIVWFL